MDIASALTMAGQALGVLRGLRSVEKEYDQVALKVQITDLIDNVVDIKSALQDAKAEIETLTAQVDRLKKSAQRRDDTVVRHGVRYPASKARPGEPQGMPYCVRCDEIDGILIPVVTGMRTMDASCPACKSQYHHIQRVLWDDEL